MLRPTWHLVAAADVRWLLALTAPRVHALNAPYHRRCGLDATTLRRTADAVCRALEGGPRTRDELRPAVAACGVAVEGTVPMALVMMHAELEGLVCSGPRRGRAHTYALMDARVPPTTMDDRDAMRAELARRYAGARGPVTAHDLAWWSGLTVTDARRGLHDAGDALRRRSIDGVAHWEVADPPEPVPVSDATHLMSVFDEYLIGYADRTAMGAAPPPGGPGARGAVTSVVIDRGRVAGVWHRRLRAGRVTVTVTPRRPPSAAARGRIEAAAARYAAFLGCAADVCWRADDGI